MRSSVLRPALVAALSLLSTAAFAGTLHLDAKQPKPADIHFLASGTTGALDIDAVGTQAVVTDDGTTVKIAVPLATVKTGIDERDEHMCSAKYVDCATYPDMVLSFAKADVHWPTEVGKSETGTAAGTFTGHGKTMPVSVKYTVQRTKPGFKIKGEFSYDTDKLGIAAVTYMGVGVDHNQSAKATIFVTEEP